MILKYNPDEARNLKAYQEIPDTAKINEGAVTEGQFFRVFYSVYLCVTLLIIHSSLDGIGDNEDDCAFSFDEI